MSRCVASNTSPWPRRIGCLALLTGLAACGSHPARHAAHHHYDPSRYYPPPGPPEDPWGPYIHEASGRFGVPELWVRRVMRQESGGQEDVISWAGAMGLMQVMPETYDELRVRYDLGDDPYDPHNNVLAGTAYIREMYDIYGTPGFLAAYNAGPKRLDDYLSNSRPLPDETRRYVAMIAPYVMSSHPVNRSPAEDYAMNDLPIDIPPGTRYGRPVQVVQARPAPVRAASHNGWNQYARLPAPPHAASPPVRTAMAYAPPPKNSHGFHIISSAMAEPIPLHHGGPATGSWAVQVGAFGNQSQAHEAVGTARSERKVSP